MKKPRATPKPAAYDHAKIEKKWQKKWASSKLYKTSDDPAKEKYYILDMFPYPSGEGLHVGHPKGYIATDIISRYQRMNGKNVLHPMGFDAFGLPAENYAIKTKTNPADSVKKNVERYKKQLEILGFDYDWSREVNTTDPEYYRWTQWIFLQLFKKGLAYESYEPINWCPVDKTGLANEDVVDGRCERCGAIVEKRPMRQWVLKITDYAERLLNDLDATDYVKPILVDKINPHVPGKPLVSREVAHAIVYDPKNKKYLIIRNKKFNWDTVIIGGIEAGEDAVETARREVKEETGYTDLEFKRILGGKTEAHYYTKHKGENRIATAQAVYFELKSDARVAIGDGEDSSNEILWVDENEFVPGKMVNSELSIWLERLKDSKKGLATPLLDWPESIKEAQRNWIGRSEGMIFTAPVKDTNLTLQTFSAHFEAFAADTFVVIAPDHPFLKDLLKGTEKEGEVVAFADALVAKRNKEGYEAGKEHEGIFTGRYIVDPVGNGDLPIWVASYALADYGTGIVKCSAHDERDFAFAKKYAIRLKPVLFPTDPDQRKKVESLEICFTDMQKGLLSEPAEFKGRIAREARKEMIAYLENKRIAAAKTTYKLHDWVFSRQRYWGEPIPLIHCEKCGVVAVPEKELPVKLPKVKSYEPTGTGESPLAAISKWVNVKCPQCKGKAKRETNTMPQWAGSSWYYLRYEDPKNKKAFVDPKKEEYWSPVDLYVGGAEHATRHLIYARFWHKFLFDIGAVSSIEPFKKLQSVGLIMGEDGRKMSKRFGNVVNPDDIVATYGADTMRIYEMFMGPFDQQIAWNTDSMIGSRRFIERVWKLKEKIAPENALEQGAGRLLHKTIKKVSHDILTMRFNTAISTLMIAVNEFERASYLDKAIFESFLKLLAPFAPHMAEELWASLGNKRSIHISEWPAYDPALAAESEATIVVQINGKTRASFIAPLDTSKEEIEKLAQGLPEAAKWLEGKEVRKIIVVPNKLVNFVV